MRIKAEDIWYPFPEYWRDIKEYEGLYQVSNWGRVKSLPRKKSLWHGGVFYTKEALMALTNNDDYRQVSLVNKEGKRITKKVHKLVSNAFIPNPNNYPIINHRNERRWENWVELDEEENIINTNLEWCTISYNVTYGTAIERAVKKRESNPNYGKPVLQYTLSGKLVREYRSAGKAGRAIEKSHSHIIECCKGKLSQAYGFIWKYKEKGETE